MGFPFGRTLSASAATRISRAGPSSTCMRTMALLLAATFFTATLLAMTPGAQARQVCTDLTGDRTCEGNVCVWDHVRRAWACVDLVCYRCVPIPCRDFMCPDPVLP